MRILLGFLMICVCCCDAIASSCSSGFDDITSTYPATFYARDTVGGCPYGYEPYSAPSFFDFTFGGLLLDSGPTLCDANSHYENGTCVSNAQGNCENSYWAASENSATFYSKYMGDCPSGYADYTKSSSLEFIFNGMLLASGPTLCASGHYVNGVCTSYDTGDCMSGYIDAGVDDIVAAVDANGSCPSGYGALGQYESCTADTSDNICTTLCDGGMSHTGAGHCAAACGIGMTTMHVGPTLTFPLYGTRTTPHVLVVANENGQCYVNLAPGRASNALNVSYNGTIYHSTN